MDHTIGEIQKKVDELRNKPQVRYAPEEEEDSEY